MAPRGHGGRQTGAYRQAPAAARITPQAIFVPELPDGCVVKSSGRPWMMTVVLNCRRMKIDA